MKHPELSLKDMMHEKREAEAEMPEMDLEPIKKLFEDEMIPAINDSQVGRLRLLRALRRKFGVGYKSIPQVKQALDHFEKEVRFMRIYKQTLGAKNGKRR